MGLRSLLILRYESQSTKALESVFDTQSAENGAQKVCFQQTAQSGGYPRECMFIRRLNIL
jgi:hypothetical protein